MTAGPHTMTKDELLELADRCEREEGSRALEGDIFEAVAGSLWDLAYQRAQEPCGCPHDTAVSIARDRAPRFATSLDAAVTLVPEQGSWEVSASGCATVTVLCGRFLVSDDIERHATGRTPALALCAAALRARASLTEKE